MSKIYLYDTTLRDGSQGEGISLSVEDKLKIVSRLDFLGIDYIEGGWPGSNPKDMEFFHQAARLPLSSSRITAFGSTRRPGITVEADSNLRALVAAGVGTVTIVGKSWDFHVYAALGTSLAENLAMIHESVAYLRGRGLEVIYDAEHFFDGFKRNPEYALETLRVAVRAGAGWVVLCDTNGGCLPQEISAIVSQVHEVMVVPLGIHTHNDGALAVANSLAAVAAGVTQVQGTINGWGERCGNADLVAIIPNLELKMGYGCLPEGKMAHLTEVSRYVAEVANVGQPACQPFVGVSAFAHKGGIHVNAVMKHTDTYEHISPEVVGNQRRILVSELSGMSSLVLKLKEAGLPELEPARARLMVEKIKELEYQGYQFEGAEGSLELLLRRIVGQYRQLFKLESLKVIVEKKSEENVVAEAVIKLRVGERVVHTAAEGDGPVNAMDNALRKALVGFYPQLADMHLADYKVRVLDGNNGTAARVRVLIESRDRSGSWSTIGVSENIIEASWQALVDSMELYLLKTEIGSQEPAAGRQVSEVRENLV
ncbi:MAG: citramalate synthase [Clostridia bacterium]|nr:MAG: citramalate synthase [Clostridia bacterium]